MLTILARGIAQEKASKYMIDGFWNGSEIGEDVVNWLGAHLWPLVGIAVEIVYIRRVMVVVVDLHGLGVDMRLKRIVSVAKRRQLKGAASRLGERGPLQYSGRAGKGSGTGQEFTTPDWRTNVW